MMLGERTLMASVRRPGPAVEALASGAMLGFAFPPSPLYTLAYVAFIPLFHLLEKATTWGRALRWGYLYVVAFHLVTVYWTGGYTVGRDGWMMIAGAALLFIHPLFYAPSMLLAWFVQRRRGRIWGIAAFVVLWTAFEYLHSQGELSFPWITVGNSQAFDLPRAQLAEFTSTLGLSFLVLAFNAVAYVTIAKLARSEWEVRSTRFSLAVAALIVMYLIPWTWGKVRMDQEAGRQGGDVLVGLVQANVDPWEKWGQGFDAKWSSYDRELQMHIDASRALASTKPDLIVWPETAIPFYILTPRHSVSLGRLFAFLDSTGVPILTGVPTAEYFPASRAPVTADRIGTSDVFVESYNSIVLLSPGRQIGPVYRKMVLVPFAERIPYAEALRFLIEPLRWNVGISSWGIGQDTVLYVLRTARGDTARFSAMICYESVYPDFVRQFVRKGAEFLLVITNDSWWGNTSGAYQHSAFASFRAIETRRWVVQCANGGISVVVNPRGEVQTSTRLYTDARLVAAIERRSGETFYVRHGDIVGRVSLCCSVLFVMFSIVPLHRKKSRDSHHDRPAK